MKRLILVVLGVCFVGTSALAQGIDEYTVLMLHCNGTDGSTDFVDDSYSNHPVTAIGDAQIDTTEKKFGTASGFFDGYADCLTIPDSDDWNFGSGDFTADCWVRFNTSPTGGPLIVGQAGQWSNFGWTFDIYTTGIHFSWATDGSSSTYKSFFQSTSFVIGQWYHVAVVRSGNNLMFFVDGTQVGTSRDMIGQTIFNSSEVLSIGGGPPNNPGGWLNGWIDEFRVSKGIARWTSNFTPPTQEYDGIPNNPPIAHAGPDVEAYVGDEVVLDGSSSYDSDGNIVSWVWRSLSHPDKPIVAEGEVTSTIAHGFVEEIIELTVTDDRGDTSTDKMSIIDTKVQAVETLHEEIGALETQVDTLEQENSQQQKAIGDHRYLLEQLPQLKKELEVLQSQVE